MANAQHLSKTADWGTPRPTVEMIRYILGGRIEFDPCSSHYWNHHTIHADRILTERDDCRTRSMRCRTMLCNPPGDPSGGLVKSIWELVSSAWHRGEADSVVWVGFSLEQLAHLQLSPMHPLQFLTLIPSKRIRFLRRGDRGGPPVAGPAPTHSNFITLLPSRGVRSVAEEQVRRFRQQAAKLDGVEHPWGQLVRPMAIGS